MSGAGKAIPWGSLLWLIAQEKLAHAGWRSIMNN